MSIFKKIGKLVASIIPGGGIIGSLISPGKTPDEVQSGLAMLDPIAQYNRTMARPRIALSIVYAYLLGTIIQWIQQIAGVPKEEIITIPGDLLTFAQVAIGAYIGSRGLEKMVSSVATAIKKRRKKK